MHLCTPTNRRIKIHFFSFGPSPSTLVLQDYLRIWVDACSVFYGTRMANISQLRQSWECVAAPTDLDVLAALLEAGCQLRHHVLVVVQDLLHRLRVAALGLKVRHLRPAGTSNAQATTFVRPQTNAQSG